MQYTLTIATFLLLVSHASYAFNILGIFIHPGKSHFDMFHSMILGLAEKGHNVTVISMFPEDNPPPTYRDVTLNEIAGHKDAIDLKVRDIFK